MDISTFLLGAAIVLSVWLATSSGVTRYQMARMERKLDALLKQAGLQDAWQPVPSEEVMAAIAAGSKIHAIKAYREQYPDLGLKEAKNIVEELMSQTLAGRA